MGEREGPWPLVEIGDVAEVVGGGTPSTRNAGNFDGDVPWLTPKDLSGSPARVVARGSRNLSRAGLANSSARLVPPGAVLLSTRAPIGYVAIAGGEVSTNQGFRNLLPRGRVRSDFLYYWLKANTEALERHAVGTTFRELPGSVLKRIRIPLPPLPEQRAVGRVLGVLDDKIEANRRMSATLEGLAQAAFKDWFVDFGPVRAKAAGRARYLPAPLWSLFPDRLVDSGMGEIPEGWVVSTIGKEVDVVGGSTPSTKNSSFWNGDVNWVTPKDLSALESPILLQTSRKITDEGLARIGSGLLPRGTVLLSSRAPIGYLAISDIPVAINQGFIAMICRGRISPSYIYLWTSMNLHSILEYANGSTFQEISKGNFRPLSIVVPPDDLRTIFDAHTEPLFERIVGNERESRALAGLRDVLLPRLVSGEIRLDDAAEKEDGR